MKKRMFRVLLVLLAAVLLAGSMPAYALRSAFIPSQSYGESEYFQRLQEVELTGDPRTDIVNIACSQLGYKEGGMEGDHGGNGRVCNNFTEYGFNFGENGNIWCTTFIWWCARQAGIDSSVFPNTIWPRLLTVNCPYIGYTSNAAINPGDLLFVENSGDDTPDHLSLVIEVTDTHIIGIEGNCGNVVCKIAYDRSIGARPDGMGNILYIGYPNYVHDPAVPDATSLMQYALITRDVEIYNKHTGGQNQGVAGAGEVLQLLAVSSDGLWCQIERGPHAYWVDASAVYFGSLDEIFAYMSSQSEIPPEDQLETTTTTAETTAQNSEVAEPSATVSVHEAVGTEATAGTSPAPEHPSAEQTAATQPQEQPAATSGMEMDIVLIALVLILILVIMVIVALVISMKKVRY